MLKYFLGAALVLALPASSAIAQNPGGSAAQVSVTVDTSKPGPVIDRHIYGQFAEHLGHGIYGGIWVGEKSSIPNIHGYRTDVVEALKKIHVPVIRWPGGCFADLYNWRDGIGPRDKRPVRINVHWGGVTEDNAFGTHEFMNFAELVGADAYVSLNVGSLTPYDAAQWLEYMTTDGKNSLAQERKTNGRDKPWRVAMVGIGNETWGCGGNMSAEYAADINRRYATFANTPRDMGTLKIASGSHDDNYAFAETMMRDGGKFDGLSVHYYTVPRVFRDKGAALGFPETEWTSTLQHARHIEEIVTRTAAIMDKYDPEKKVGLYVDEWGTWYDPAPGSNPGFLVQQNSLRDAEVAALSLDAFQRHTDRVKGANIAQMINVLQAMILTDGPRMVLTPTYHIFDMYQVFMGATPYPAAVNGPDFAQGVPMVDVSAARGKDGKLYLALVNTDPRRAAHVVTNLDGTGKGMILTGPAMDTHNTFDAPNTIHPVAFAGRNEGGKAVFDLPSKSIAVVAIQ
ncbi:MAG TPA: alpha-L-arabinofuranosidase C-terminal domain-containing protein [Rhizomicrobium sp.]|jgi:alpha-N-arabinofuranosidase|nr:alpha-L-arabinofuranosidase C-terminal domain-containing protein [Rhizomicrobium sp.]